MTQTGFTHNSRLAIKSPLIFMQIMFNTVNRIQSQMATGYNADGSVALLFDLGWISPAGQMFSSARDLDIVSCIYSNS